MKSYWKYWRVSLWLFPAIVLLLLVVLDVSNWLVDEQNHCALAYADAHREWVVAEQADDASAQALAASKMDTEDELFRLIKGGRLACNWILFGLTLPLAWVTWQLTSRRESPYEAAGRYAALALPVVSLVVMLMPDPGQRWLVVQVLGLVVWLGVTAAIQKVALHLADYRTLARYGMAAKGINVFALLYAIVFFNWAMIPPAFAPWIVTFFWLGNYAAVATIAWICLVLAGRLKHIDGVEQFLIPPELHPEIFQQIIDEQARLSEK